MTNIYPKDRHCVSSPDFREKFISEILNTIESEDFVKRNCIERDTHFTRKRKLTFTYLIVLIIQGLSRSIQRELNSFFAKLTDSDFSIQEVTKGAFTHARKKLKAEAFIELNQVGNKSFYRDAPYLTWNNFRLLAIDGSTLMLPNHPTIEKEFGLHQLNANEESIKPAARISMLFDVLNYTVLDAEIDRYDVSERELALRHLPQIKAGNDLVIMDRGYPSFKLMYELQQKGIDYCIRMRDNWWEEIKEMRETGEADKVITIQGEQLFELFPNMKLFHQELICRVVIVELPNGGIEILVTSLLDNEKYHYDSFVKLYNSRWAIEEGFKFFKTRLQVEAFSGKTALAVKQDFFAKVFMMTTTAVMAFPVEQRLKDEQAGENKKHSYKTNRTVAASFIKEMTFSIFIKRIIRTALSAFDKIVRATVEVVRPNRKSPRKKKNKQPPSMGYKQL